MFFSAVKLGILTCGVYGTDSRLQPASSGQSMNCSVSHFLIGFKRESGGLPLDWDAPMMRGKRCVSVMRFVVLCWWGSSLHSHWPPLLSELLQGRPPLTKAWPPHSKLQFLFLFFSWQEIHLLRCGTAVSLYDHIKRETRTSASRAWKSYSIQMSFSTTTVNCGLMRCY